MKFILEFIAVITVGILPSLLATLLYLRDANYLKKADQFSVFERLPSTWLSNLASIAVVLLVAYQQPSGFVSIGIRSGQWGRNIGAVFVGFFGINLFIIFFALGQRIILHIVKQPLPPPIDTSNPLITDMLRYQDFWERLANLAVLPFSTISEDLIFRGYLILFLGELTNTFTPWAIISIFLMVMLHLYQGRNTKTIVFHILLAIFFTGLTVATQNILAPISAHVYFNFVSSIKLWSLVKNQGQQSAITANSNKKKFAYALFAVTNVFILIVATIIVLA